MSVIKDNSGLIVGGLGLGIIGLMHYYANEKKSDPIDRISITCSSGVNIAVIKYWGKRDENLILPLNSSLSATLDQADLKTVTTVVASKSFTQDEIWLNGKKEDISNPRIQRVLSELRSRATQFVDPHSKLVLVKNNEWSQYKLRIVSENNFPTAAGLASSASGYCCLVFTLAQLFGVQGEISTVARMGSGSACRSMYGGWVKWDMGKLSDGSDSKAIQVTTENHWPEMQILVLVVNDQKKDTSSTDGMQQSVITSKLLAKRVTDIVPKRMDDIEEAIMKKDFATFGEITMRDSDSFHDVCADTTPAIYYLKQISRDIIHIINCYNKFTGSVNAAYTFDAGPNAVIYLLQDHVAPILALTLRYLPPVKTPVSDFFKDPEMLRKAQAWSIPKELENLIGLEAQQDAIKYVLRTRPGPGPQVLPRSQSLINADGTPKKVKQ